jgi:hypothetical protein
MKYKDCMAKVPSGRSIARVWVSVALAVVLIGVLFAPIATYGFCADSANPDLSVCGSEQQSIVGIPSNLWVWSIATLVAILIGWVVARRRRAEGSN